LPVTQRLEASLWLAAIAWTASGEALKVGVKIQLEVILSSFYGKRKAGIKIKFS